MSSRDVQSLLQRFLILLIMGVAFGLPAKEGYRDAFFEAFRSNGYPIADYILTPPSFVAQAEKPDCLVCHYDPKGGGPRNLYGEYLEPHIKNINENKAAELIAAIWPLVGDDADEDGYSTLTEVTDPLSSGGPVYDNTPTFPGLTAANVHLVKTKDLESADVDYLQEKLVPTSSVDLTPPSLTVVSPNGGETLIADVVTTISWQVSDAGSGVAGLDIYLSLDDGATFAPVAYLTGGAARSGSYDWVPPNRPSTQALVQMFALDNAGNTATDESNAPFTIESPVGGLVPTTLRDFDMPGTQPLENRIHALQDPQTCASCHGGYDSTAEPYHAWQGSMMSLASIDFMFEANLVIANQDAPESGDLCLRCHKSRGWLAGRSTPTDGSRMLLEDHIGVSCDLCHRLVDPRNGEGAPIEDADILAALTQVPAGNTTGHYVVDPSGTRRGPSEITTPAHPVLVSPFHKSSELCGTCHDVSNPVFVRPEGGVSGDEYVAAPLDQAAEDLSSEVLMPVERTFSEWRHSAFNSETGLLRPEFAGNKTDGRVASCQDCHMRDVTGRGSHRPSSPLRDDFPMHDLTGASTWVPGVLAVESPSLADPEAVSDGIARARYMLENALQMQVTDNGAQLRVRLINRTGHKLPTGYPEGRRMWANVRFYDASSALIKEVGGYDPDSGVLELSNPELKVYETKPGIGPDLRDFILARDSSANIDAGPSFHFVLNNKIYKDNRIPPEGFTHAGYDSFGGAPVGHHYADGQYWDDTWYQIPSGTDRAEIRVYFQSVSKEFVEFLRDENHTNNLGDEVYDLWFNHGKAPPELMTETIWFHGFVFTAVESDGGEVLIHFASKIGETYHVEYADQLESGALQWRAFENSESGTLTAISETSLFVDDFTAATSGGPSADNRRFYRVYR